MNTRTRNILEDLEAVRENLLALSDDIWGSIDRQDIDAFDEGVQFMRNYIERMTEFDRVAEDISSMVQQYTSVRLAEGEQSGGDNREENDRIVAELNHETPHSIDEDFTYKRPHGYILDGAATTGITTWRRLFELLCNQLLRRDHDRFHGLPDHPNLISNRGNRSFSRNTDELRSATESGDGLYAEINLSANSLCSTIKKLHDIFDIPRDHLQLFLRQDRDAGRSNDGT